MTFGFLASIACHSGPHLDFKQLRLMKSNNNEMKNTCHFSILLLTRVNYNVLSLVQEHSIQFSVINKNSK